MATGSTLDCFNMAKNFFLEKDFFRENALEMQIVGAGIVAVLLWRVIKTFRGSRPGLNLPPGPRNLPVVGAMFSTEANINERFKKMARKFGKIFYYRVGANGVLVVCSAEGAEEVLKTKDAIFANRPVNTLMKSVAKYIGYGSEDILFCNFDEKHKSFKKMLVSNVLSNSQLTRVESIRRREGAFLVADIQRQMSSEGVVNVSVTTFNMTINLLCSLVFGRRYADSVASETDLLRHCPTIIRGATGLILELVLGDIFPWLSWTHILGTTNRLKEFNRLSKKAFGQIIEEHREVKRTNKNYTDQDFLDILLTLNEKGKVSDSGLFGAILDMLVGGTDSNAITTEWAMLKLVKNPDCLTKLQEELDEVLGRGRIVEESDFPKLPYFQAVIQETFRLHPPLPVMVPHFTYEAGTVQGFHVPANTSVFINVGVIGRDPLLWKDPDRFDPSRFMNTPEANINVTDGVVFSLLPFGSGRRKCPGAAMGYLTVQRTLATLVHAFDWSPLPGTKKEDIDESESVTGVLRPKIPIFLRAQPRLNPTIYTQLIA